MTQSALELLARSTAEQHRTMIELKSLFAKHGGRVSTHWLTQARPERNVHELEETRSFAVLNFSPVTIQVGWGGRSATAGNAMPVLANSYIQLPLETNSVILGAAPSEIEEAGGQAMVMFIRYQHLMGLAGGPLTGAGGGAAGTAETANTVTGASPGTVAVGNVSGLVIAANTTRKGLNIQNTGASTVSLGLGHPAVLGRDLVLAPEASWDGRVSGALWRGAVNAIATAAGTLAVVEV
jgi:hypothetical protein